MSTAQVIPERISDTDVLHLLKMNKVNWEYVKYVKDFSNMNDKLLSEWLNINVKTFRSYKKQNAELKENLQEHVVLLISLFKHGVEIFGDTSTFHKWLETDNFFLDKEKPSTYLKTVTGIRFIDDRLTAIEFGDNV